MPRKYFVVEVKDDDLDDREELYALLHVYKVKHHTRSRFAALSEIIHKWQEQQTKKNTPRK